MQKVKFISYGSNLIGHICYPKRLNVTSPAILFLHGWNSNQQRNMYFAEKLSEIGYVCFLFDVRGHGESEGDLKAVSQNSFLEDAQAAYDYLLGVNEVDKENISIIGSSFGAYIGSILTKSRMIKSMSMRVPSNYPPNSFSKPVADYINTEETNRWRTGKLSYDATPSLKALHDFTGNVLIVESELDEQVPHQTVQNYIDAVQNKQKLTYKLMKGAHHKINGEENSRKKYLDILIGWYSNNFTVIRE